MKNSRKNRLFRSLLATTLLLGGTFQLAAPVLADGTAAGTPIQNQATATYEDPNNPGTQINATSNTVTITVAEVAGITVTAAGITDNTGGQVAIGDQLSYDYIITNVGNDPTRLRIPNLATVTGPGRVFGNLQISTNGGANYTDITGSEQITGPIQPNTSIRVRVRVNVTAGATTNAVIGVKLGQTPGDAQNQLRSPDGGDVYTVDYVNGTPTTPVPEVDGAPVNGTREASLTQQTTVASTAQAFATVLENRTDYSPGTDLNAFTDDVVTYGLGLRVESTAPAGSTGLVPADLTGRTVNGIGNNRVLVSDAIPANTTLITDLTGPNALGAPAGWQVVYTTDAPLTTNANDATWSTTAPQDPSTITRIGFVYDATTTPIAKGTTVSGFKFSVKPTAAFTAGSQVANIAQLFGQTVGGTTLVYDESGDQSPSNFNDNGTRGLETATNGIADSANGIDTANNNTGRGPGGESNVFTISGTATIQNLPNGQQQAIGPISDNDDFTNKSTLVPANTVPGSTFDPAAVSFTNTARNTGSGPANISLLPLAPANPADLPTDTLVTITYGSLSATYEYTGTVFQFRSGTGTVNGSAISASNPIRIDDVAQNTSVNYGVEVNLPDETPLSTDLTSDYTGDVEYGFPVRVVAFVDGGTIGELEPTEPQNITIDRLYTGFLRLFKESRVLPGSGPAVVGTNGTFSDANKTPSPGNIIEYRITYTNISTPPGISGNVILNAGGVVITEDGTTGDDTPAGPNNWALDQDPANSPGFGTIDTSNVVGSATDSGASTITFFSGNNPAQTPAIDQTGTTITTDVTRYVNTVTGVVTPGQARTFQFQRKLN